LRDQHRRRVGDAAQRNAPAGSQAVKSFDYARDVTDGEVATTEKAYVRDPRRTVRCNECRMPHATNWAPCLV